MEVCTAVILNAVPYNDTQKIIHVYSREKGYLSLISPPRLFRRKNNPAHLMQISEISYFENEKTGLHKLHSIAPVSNMPDLYFDVVKMNIVLLWGEVLNLLLRKEVPDKGLFDYICRSAEYLNSLSAGAGNFNLFFLYRLSGFIGFRINTESWQKGYLFHPADASFYPEGSGPGSISGPNTAAIIHTLCTCTPDQSALIPLNRQARNILMDIIFHFFSLHLNIRFDLKSIRVIREVFQ